MADNKNAISSLKEFHDKRPKSEKTLAEPKYSEFVQTLSGFKGDCIYRNLTTKGIGKTKKEAKCQAAQQMLVELNVSVSSNKNHSNSASVKKSASSSLSGAADYPYKSTPEIEAQASAFIKKYADPEGISYSRYPPKPKDLDVCFNDIDFGMKSENSPKSKTLLERLDKEMKPIDCFQKVMEEFGLKFWAQKMDTNSEAGDVHVVMIKIDFHFMVVGGKGASLGEAVEKACQNAIDTFRLYMR